MADDFENKEELMEEEAEEKEQDEYEEFCFLCRRPESQVGKMIELPNNIHICSECMQKSFDTMNEQMSSGKMNYMDLLNMPGVSMIDLSNFQNPLQKPKKIKKKRKRRSRLLT